MLERTSEKLLDSLSELEQLKVKDRNLFLDTKAQGLVLLKLITKLSQANVEDIPEGNVEKAKEAVEEYTRAVGYIKLSSDIDRKKEAEHATGDSGK